MKHKKIKGPQNHHLFIPIRDDGSERDNYWVRIFKTGKGRLEESLGTNSLGEARILRDKRVAEWLGKKPKFAGKGLLCEDKFAEFLELKRGKAKATYESMRNQWEIHLKDYFGGMLLDEITGSEWLRYVNKKRAVPEYKDRKFFNDRKYLSMFLHWCHREGFLEKLPKLEDVDPEITAGKVFTDDEIQGLLSAAGAELRTQIIMAITMGMRHGEIWSLEWSQIDFKRRTIHLPAEKTKIRESRTFAMSEAVHTLLRDHRESTGSIWVFPHADDETKPQGRFGTKSAWDRCRRKAGVEGRFHDLRHTFLTRSFKTSTNPALICHYAGLSLEEAYRTYLHFDSEDTRAVSDLVGVNL